MEAPNYANPFRPGAGHMPPYLAGRENEKQEFLNLLSQDVILENLVLTGLRGVGKTVLLDTFKPLAMQNGWLWAGTDLSESASVSEERIAVRLIADLSLVTSGITITEKQILSLGFNPQVKNVNTPVNYDLLLPIYQQTPGMVADKIKAVLEFGWECVRSLKKKGIIFAYDEAQNLADHSAKDEYPLSLLLDVFQSIQKKNIPFMLALTGLPTLFPKLVEARTFAERMFHVVQIGRLPDENSREALAKPIRDVKHPVSMGDALIAQIISISGGYPYFIQFLGKEVYDVVLQKMKAGSAPKDGEIVVPFDDIVRKLDADFFAGRWSKATDRQRDLMTVIASLPTSGEEFTVQEVVERSKEVMPSLSFSASHTSQMLSTLSQQGLIYKNRHGKYSFAVPLFDRFITRQKNHKAE